MLDICVMINWQDLVKIGFLLNSVTWLYCRFQLYSWPVIVFNWLQAQKTSEKVLKSSHKSFAFELAKSIY